MKTRTLRHGWLFATATLTFFVSSFAIAEDNSDNWKWTRHDIAPSSTYSACAAMDVNKDGRTDIVCGGFWYESPTWKRHFLRDVEVIRGRFDDYSNLPIDVNGDGWLDLVSANYRSQTLYWIEHPGEKLGPWTTHTVERPGPMETARLEDIDGDGKLDLLPNGTRAAMWYEITQENGKARWIRHELPSEIAGHGVGFGDINGDGRGDIVCSQGWLEGPPDARKDRWNLHRDFRLHADSSIPMLVFDVDDDGDADIVYSRAHHIGLYWVEQQGPGKWRRHAIDTSWSQSHAPMLGDLDGDGRPEVVAGKRYMGHDGKDLGEYDSLIVAAYTFQPQQRTWQRRTICESWTVGFGLDSKLADLDGDGDLDIIATGRSGLSWLENGRLSPSSLLPQEDVKPADLMPAPEYEDHRDLSVYLTHKAGEMQRTPIDSPATWAHRRRDVLANLQRVMGTLPGSDQRVPLDVEVLETTDTEKYQRQKITYAAQPGDRVPAYLLIPHKLLADRSGQAKAMLCLHQTTRIGKGEPAGLGGKENLHYAHELAERGYICLVPDYPSFGDYDYDFTADKLPSGSMKAIWNNIRGVDLLESLPQVHPDRIGCIGHSLGGHNTIFTGVFDQRIAAMVSSCGFNGFHHYYGGRLAGWTSERYMPRIASEFGNDPDKVPFDFHELVAALSPRGFFVNAPLKDSNFEVAGVREVEAAAGKIYALWGKPEQLKVVYPDAAHDFPPEVRKQAYEWLDEQLK